MFDYTVLKKSYPLSYLFPDTTGLGIAYFPGLMALSKVTLQIASTIVLF